MNIFNTQHLQLITAANLSSIEVMDIAKRVRDYADTRPQCMFVIPCPILTPMGFAVDQFVWSVDELAAIADASIYTS